ncbi:MAG: ArnT family glycosyltransferase [Patescibacteria group bacterium]
MPKIKKSTLWLLAFCLVIIFAAILRFYKLGQIPVSLYWDEAAMLVDAKTLSQTGKDMHNLPFFQTMFLSYGDYKLPIYIWLATFSVKLFGVSNLALRLPSALAGLGSVAIAGVLAQNLFETRHLLLKNNKDSSEKSLKLLSLISMIVMAISPWSLTFSRTGFEGHLAQFFLSVSVLFLVRKKTPQNVLFSIIFGSLATYTYFSVRYVWPVLSLFSLVFIHKQNWKKDILLTIASLLLFSLSLIPMTKSPFYQDSNRFRLSTTSILNKNDWPVVVNQYRQDAGNHFYHKFIFNKYTLIGKELIENYSDHLNLSYIFIYGDTNLRHGTSQHGLFLWPFILPFLAGLYFLAKERLREFLFIIVWWLIALLPASVPDTTPHALRSLNALMPLCLIISFGFYRLAQDFLSKKRLIILAGGLIWIFITTIFSLSYLSFYYRIYPQLSASSWQNGYDKLAKQLLSKNDQVRTVWVEPFDNRFYLWLLIQDEFSAVEIQQIVGQQHMPEKVSNFDFKGFDWPKLNTLDHKIIVAGKKANLEQKINEYNLQPNWLEESKNQYQQEPFWILGYGN